MTLTDTTCGYSVSANSGVPQLGAELPGAMGTALRRVLEAGRLAAQHLDPFGTAMT